MRSIRTYLNILREKGFRYSFVATRRRVRENIVYSHLKKRYGKTVLTAPPTTTPIGKNSENPFPNKIWVLWLQGESEAPAIVKKCIKSIREHSNGREVVMLSDANISHYITIPNFILKKKGKGIISNTHFSDIVRILLLEQYGGIWMDATIYQTGILPNYIANAPLFCFKSPFLMPGHIKASNWFIKAEPHNEIISNTRKLLLSYWEHEKKLKHYFLFHLFFSIAIESSPHRRDLWESVPYFNNVTPHTLQFELFRPFNKERWEQIREMSPVHKLTYKFVTEESAKEGTLYSKIIS